MEAGTIATEASPAFVLAEDGAHTFLQSGVGLQQGAWAYNVPPKQQPNTRRAEIIRTCFIE